MHDWTLVEIRIDWAASSAVLIALDECSLSRSIFFRGLREFSADRREHWGPSSSINEASWDDSSTDGGVSLKVEMQSGGMISISAAAADIDGMPCMPTIGSL
ncbi:hypothetical protein D3C87_994080 [compost metagenome]